MVEYFDMLCATGFTQHPIQYMVHPQLSSQSKCNGDICTGTEKHLKEPLWNFETGNYLQKKR